MVTVFAYAMLMFVTVGSMLFGAGWLMQPRPRPADAASVHSAMMARPGDDRSSAGQARPQDIGPRAKVVAQAPARPAPASETQTASRGARAAEIAAPASHSPPAIAASEPQTAAAQTGTVQAAAAQAVAATPFSLAGANERAAAPDAQQSAATCNYHACAESYRSFRASDCTYQPYEGPRRVCEKSARTAEASLSLPRAALDARAQQVCNVQACGREYHSFDAATCTYQPYGGGPRRLCTR